MEKVKNRITLLFMLMCCIMLCFGTLQAFAGQSAEVKIRRVEYTNGTPASAKINFTYSGERITTIDPMIGLSKGTYELDLDTQDALNLPPGWSLTKEKDGSWTLITTSQGVKPNEGQKIWVGVDVFGSDSQGNNLTGSDQIQVIVPAEGQTATAGETETVVEIPESKTFVYNLAKQTGVVENAGYTRSGIYEATDTGAYACTLTLQSGYKWSDGTKTAKDVNWYIKPAKITGVVLSQDTFEYTGELIKPILSHVYGDPVNPTGEDWSSNLVSLNSVEPGTYTVVVTGIKNFTGQASATYTITEKKITVTSKEVEKGEICDLKPVVKGVKAKSNRKKILVQWKKPSKKQLKKFDYYEVEYSKYSNFEDSKILKVGKKKVKRTISGLKRRTKYYYRVRKVKETSNGKHVSKWTKSKKIRTR